MQNRPGTYTLIIRYWHEPAAAGLPVLRGSIEHVQSGERVYFETAEDLAQKIQGYLLPPSMSAKKGDHS